MSSRLAILCTDRPVRRWERGTGAQDRSDNVNHDEELRRLAGRVTLLESRVELLQKLTGTYAHMFAQFLLAPESLLTPENQAIARGVKEFSALLLKDVRN
jgi:hypothetical protein